MQTLLLTALTIVSILIVIAGHLVLCRSTKRSWEKIFWGCALIGFVLLCGLLALFACFSPAPFFLSGIVVYVLSMPLYLYWFNRINGDGPSNRILRILNSRSGFSYDELVQLFDSRHLLETLIADLERQNCIFQEGGKVLLTSKGRCLVFFNRLDKKFLRLSRD